MDKKYFFVRHGVCYKQMCEYNKKLPYYFMSKNEDLRLELLTLRQSILKMTKDIKATLNDKEVLELLNHEDQ